MQQPLSSTMKSCSLGCTCPPITLGEIASYYQFVLHTLKSLVHDCPPQVLRHGLTPSEEYTLPVCGDCHLLTLPTMLPISITLLFIILHHSCCSVMPPPDEVRTTILVVLCLNGLAASIGFCVNRTPHNNKLNYQSHSESHSP